MKDAQNDEANPNMHPARLPLIPGIENTQLSPSGSSVRKRGTPGILSRLFSPFTGITSYCVRAQLAPLLVMSCIDMHLFALYSLFLPPLLSVDYETNAAAGAPVDYVVDDPYLLEQLGKPRPLITRYRLFFSLLLALE